MKTADYWKRRYDDLDQNQFNYSVESFRKVEDVLMETEIEINNKINYWMSRLATNNKVSLLEARRMLNTKELKELRWDVNKYIRKGQENSISQKWIKELENASAKAHITRLEALQLHLQQFVEVAFLNQLDEVDSFIKTTYINNYNRSRWILETRLQMHFDLVGVDETQLKLIMNTPWAEDDKIFSNRIWNNKSEMISELQKNLLRTCATGESPDRAIKEMEKFVSNGVGKASSRASALIQTEQAAFSTMARMKNFEDMGVQRYEISATFDISTSEICKKMNKQIFNVAEKQIGTNAPPFHVRCRTSTAPYPEKKYFTHTRAARDADGKTIHIPEDMTYDEWFEKYGKYTKK